jgi:cytochrome c heme-lyase
MGWWKADPVPSSTEQQATSPPSPHPVAPPTPPSTTASESACPVDPKTRSLWLQHAQAKAQTGKQDASTPLPPSHPPLPTPPPQPLATKECSSDRITGQTAAPPHPPTITPPRPLSQERAISSIPRSNTHSSSPYPQTTPANAESESGHHPSGNWIYPSETQFFNAVMSKNTTSSPSALLSSISHIIPMHNAVNERAWSLIKSWEGNSSDRCGGPKLASFAGRGGGASSPRAKWNVWVMGKREPFDRHDWVVERCDGSTVDYVIDFYEGKKREGGGGGKEDVSFYLDVRPKLNSFEGVRMRAERMWGSRS